MSTKFGVIAVSVLLLGLAVGSLIVAVQLYVAAWALDGPWPALMLYFCGGLMLGLSSGMGLLCLAILGLVGPGSAPPWRGSKRQ